MINNFKRIFGNEKDVVFVLEITNKEQFNWFRRTS
uniref:Uncharacterized protein n=1 Tax=viral metagenome TaxID=1070528 RepID=A0A6C0IPL6_9ZZZZ